MNGAEKNEPTAAQPEAGYQLQADPAHPTPVQGSDGGRAQGETAREESEAKAKES